VEVPHRDIGSGEQVDAEAVLDFGNQPDYRGNLLLVADGSSAEGQRLFTLQLAVSVR
jgi:hypothetical protein